MFGLSIFALTLFKAEWWYYLLLPFGPDISMIGYAGGNKMGAFMYNLFHHKGIAIFIFVLGWLMHNDNVQIAGIILFGHSSIDRVLGYGLKLKEGFRYTHLGSLDKK